MERRGHVARVVSQAAVVPSGEKEATSSTSAKALEPVKDYKKEQSSLKEKNKQAEWRYKS